MGLDVLYGPNVLLGLLGAAGVLVMFLVGFAATPTIGARSLGRFGGEDMQPHGWQAGLQRRLDQAVPACAGMTMSAGEFARVAAVAAVAGVAVGYAVTHTVTGTLLLGALGPLAYWNVLTARVDKGRQQYQESLARAASILRDSVAAGKTMEYALQDVARRGPRLVQADFQEVLDEYQMGRSLEEALIRIRVRRQDPVLDVLVENILVHTGSDETAGAGGSGIVAVMERLAEATRRRAEVRRRVRAEQARVVWEARGVSIAPFVVLLLSRLTIPELVTPFYATPWGELAILLVAAISAGTYFLVQKIAAAPLRLFSAVFVAPSPLADEQAFPAHAGNSGEARRGR